MRQRPAPLTVVVGAILTTVVAAAYVTAAVALVAGYFLSADPPGAWLFVVIVLALILVPGATHDVVPASPRGDRTDC